MKFSVEWSMPSRWTFEMPPVRRFLERWLDGRPVIVDPFCGRSEIGTLRNDIVSGLDAEDFCWLLNERGVGADAVLFDPPYSPRQVAECYKAAGRIVTQADTRNATLYKRVRKPLAALLKPGGVALSFGWNSAGFGRAWPTEEILLVQHGGAHNDTICVAQRKPHDTQAAVLDKPHRAVSTERERTMKTETAEQIGQMADRCDNLLGALVLPLPPKMHIEQITSALKEMRDELRGIYIAETGENVWEFHPE